MNISSGSYISIALFNDMRTTLVEKRIGNLGKFFGFFFIHVGKVH